MAQNAGKAVDGSYRVWIKVEFTPTLSQLADYLWDGRTLREYDEWGPDTTMTMARVREAVQTSLYRRGAEWFVEDDDQYDHEGGREWALAQVKRTYKFPEA